MSRKNIFAQLICVVFISPVSAEVISITDKKEVSDWGGSCAHHIAHVVGKGGQSPFSLDGSDALDSLSDLFIDTFDVTDIRFQAKNLTINTFNGSLSVQVQLAAQHLRKGNGWVEDVTKSVSTKLITCKFYSAVKGEGRNKVPSVIAVFYEDGDGGYAYTRYTSEVDCIQNKRDEFARLYCSRQSFPIIDRQNFTTSPPRY